MTSVALQRRLAPSAILDTAYLSVGGEPLMAVARHGSLEVWRQSNDIAGSGATESPKLTQIWASPTEPGTDNDILFRALATSHVLWLGVFRAPGEPSSSSSAEDDALFIFTAKLTWLVLAINPVSSLSSMTTQLKFPGFTVVEVGRLELKEEQYPKTRVERLIATCSEPLLLDNTACCYTVALAVWEDLLSVISFRRKINVASVSHDSWCVQCSGSCLLPERWGGGLDDAGKKVLKEANRVRREAAEQEGLNAADSGLRGRSNDNGSNSTGAARSGASGGASEGLGNNGNSDGEGASRSSVSGVAGGGGGGGAFGSASTRSRVSNGSVDDASADGDSSGAAESQPPTRTPDEEEQWRREGEALAQRRKELAGLLAVEQDAMEAAPKNNRDIIRMAFFASEPPEPPEKEVRSQSAGLEMKWGKKKREKLRELKERQRRWPVLAILHKEGALETTSMAPSHLRCVALDIGGSSSSSSFSWSLSVVDPDMYETPVPLSKSASPFWVMNVHPSARLSALPLSRGANDNDDNIENEIHANESEDMPHDPLRSRRMVAVTDDEVVVIELPCPISGGGIATQKMRSAASLRHHFMEREKHEKTRKMDNSDNSNSKKADCGVDEVLEGEDSSDHKNVSKEHKGEEEETCEDREKAGFFEPVIYSGMNEELGALAVLSEDPPIFLAVGVWGSLEFIFVTPTTTVSSDKKEWVDEVFVDLGPVLFAENDGDDNNSSEQTPGLQYIRKLKELRWAKCILSKPLPGGVVSCRVVFGLPGGAVSFADVDVLLGQKNKDGIVEDMFPTSIHFWRPGEKSSSSPSLFTSSISSVSSFTSDSWRVPITAMETLPAAPGLGCFLSRSGGGSVSWLVDDCSYIDNDDDVHAEGIMMDGTAAERNKKENSERIVPRVASTDARVAVCTGWTATSAISILDFGGLPLTIEASDCDIGLDGVAYNLFSFPLSPLSSSSTTTPRKNQSPKKFNSDKEQVVNLRDLLVCVMGVTGDARALEIRRTGKSDEFGKLSYDEVKMQAIENRKEGGSTDGGTTSAFFAEPNEKTIAVLPIMVAEAPSSSSLSGTNGSSASSFGGGDHGFGRAVPLVLHASETSLRVLRPSSKKGAAPLAEYRLPSDDGAKITAVATAPSCIATATPLPLVAVAVSREIPDPKSVLDRRFANTSAVLLFGVGFERAVDLTTVNIDLLAQTTLSSLRAEEMWKENEGAGEKEKQTGREDKGDSTRGRSIYSTPSIARLCLFDGVLEPLISEQFCVHPSISSSPLVGSRDNFSLPELGRATTNSHSKATKSLEPNTPISPSPHYSAIRPRRQAFVALSFWTDLNEPTILIACAEGLPLSISAALMLPRLSMSSLSTPSEESTSAVSFYRVMHVPLPVSTDSPICESARSGSAGEGMHGNEVTPIRSKIKPIPSDATEASSQITSLALVDFQVRDAATTKEQGDKRGMELEQYPTLPCLVAGLADGRVVVGSLLLQDGEVRLGEAVEYRIGRLPVERLLPFCRISASVPEGTRFRPAFGVLANGNDVDAIVHHCRRGQPPTRSSSSDPDSDNHKLSVCLEEIVVSRLVVESQTHYDFHAESSGNVGPVEKCLPTRRRCMCILSGSIGDRADSSSLSLIWADDSGRLSLGELGLKTSYGDLDSNNNELGPCDVNACIVQRRVIGYTVTQMLYLPHVDALIVACAMTPVQCELRVYDAAASSSGEIRELWRNDLAPLAKVTAMSLAPSHGMPWYGASVRSPSLQRSFGGVADQGGVLTEEDGEELHEFLLVEPPSGDCWQAVAVATQQLDHDGPTVESLRRKAGGIIVLEVRRRFSEDVLNELMKVDTKESDVEQEKNVDRGMRSTVGVTTLGCAVLPRCCHGLAMAMPAPGAGASAAAKTRRPFFVHGHAFPDPEDGVVIATMDDALCVLGWSLVSQEHNDYLPEDQQDPNDLESLLVPCFSVKATAESVTHGCLTALSVYREWVAVVEFSQSVLLFRVIIDDDDVELQLVAKCLDDFISTCISIIPHLPPHLGDEDENNLGQDTSRNTRYASNREDGIGVLVADQHRRCVFLLRWNQHFEPSNASVIDSKKNEPTTDVSGLGSDGYYRGIVPPPARPPDISNTDDPPPPPLSESSNALVLRQLSESVAAENHLDHQEADPQLSPSESKSNGSSATGLAEGETEDEAESDIEDEAEEASYTNQATRPVMGLYPTATFGLLENVSTMRSATFSNVNGKSDSGESYSEIGAILGGVGGSIMAVRPRV